MTPTLVASARERAETHVVRSGQMGGVNLVGVMFAIILASAVGMVGVKVISAIDQSMSFKANSTYANASNHIAGGFAQAMSLTNIVFLVLMFVVVIGALFLARHAGGGGPRGGQ